MDWAHVRSRQVPAMISAHSAPHKSRLAGLWASLTYLALLAGYGGGEGEDPLEEFRTISGNPGGTRIFGAHFM